MFLEPLGCIHSISFGFGALPSLVGKQASFPLYIAQLIHNTKGSGSGINVYFLISSKTEDMSRNEEFSFWAEESGGNISASKASWKIVVAC